MTSELRSFLLILTIGTVTLLIRALPFLLFPEGRKIPRIITYLGATLTPAVIGMLVIYALKDTDITTYPHAIPQAVAIGMTVLIHIYKRNTLLSITLGTITYIALAHLMG